MIAASIPDDSWDYQSLRRFTRKATEDDVEEGTAKSVGEQLVWVARVYIRKEPTKLGTRHVVAWVCGDPDRPPCGSTERLAWWYENFKLAMNRPALRAERYSAILFFF